MTYLLGCVDCYIFCWMGIVIELVLWDGGGINLIGRTVLLLLNGVCIVKVMFGIINYVCIMDKNYHYIK